MWHRVLGGLLTKVLKQSSGLIFIYIDCCWISRTLKMTPICCREAPGTIHLLSRRHVPEERWRLLHRCASLETSIKLAGHNKILMKWAQLNSFLLFLILLRVSAMLAIDRQPCSDAQWSSTYYAAFPVLTTGFSGLDRSVGIATGYGLDGPGIESRWGRDLPHLSRPTLGPTQPPVQWVLGLSRGRKRPGRDADPSPPSSAEV
jgi:hypothetical protein